MGAEFEVTGIESDQDNYLPYSVRLVCSTKGGGGTDKLGGGTDKLVVWGKDNQMANVERIRQAQMPCVVSCDWSEPPYYAKKRGEVAWVTPDAALSVL